jgi:chloride channel protein, CIC family
MSSAPPPEQPEQSPPEQSEQSPQEQKEQSPPEQSEAPPPSRPELAYLRLVAIGAAIGIPAALAAAGFLALVQVCEDWLWTDLPDHLGADEPPVYLLIALPVIGAALVWAARHFLPGDGGHPPLLGIGGAPVPWRHAPSIVLAAFGTLAFGAVLGPEAPLIAIGSVVGMIAVALTPTRLDPRGERVLATAGSFSAVSALFGGPLVAGLLLLEAGLAAGTALTPALIPGLVAAAIGYVLFVGIGTWGGIHETKLAVPDLPVYQGTHIRDLLLAIVVGIVTAAAIAATRRLGWAVDARAKLRMAPVLLAGGLAVGLLAEVVRLLGANSQDELFSGQSGIPDLVVEGSAATILVLLVGKAIGYGICLGCGFRGGPVFPAIFLGVAVAMLPVIWFDASPTWAVAVGAAAGMTAGTRLVFASLLFSTLLVGTVGLDASPSAVLATAAAWLVMTAVRTRWPEPADAPAGAPVAAGSG